MSNEQANSASSDAADETKKPDHPAEAEVEPSGGDATGAAAEGIKAYTEVNDAGDATAETDIDVTADVSEDGPPDSRLNELEELKESLAAAEDRALRATADAQNAKRRAEMDVEKARKFALERFASELLPVVDNLERSREAALAAGDEAGAITEGVELTLKSFVDVLQKFGIAPIDPAGEPFDPQMHQAMSMVESPDSEPNTVLDVMQKGYQLNGRLVRPAMVIVSKAPG
ncbi:MAG: nucleotide exchange factor GrpE [Pseudomonadota bacterium]